MDFPKPSPPRRKVELCPHPKKLAFPTESLSENSRREELAKMVDRGWTKYFPIRSYWCKCTWWHWTSHLPHQKGQHEVH